jgi:hypothetical protein
MADEAVCQREMIIFGHPERVILLKKVVFR